MEVVIVEAETGNVVRTYPIVLGYANSNISEDDYYSEAWTSAVEDGLVDPNKKSDCRFRLGG
jgi:hypothetical protein